MKKFLLSLAMVLGAGCFMASADDATITAKDLCGNPSSNTPLENTDGWTSGDYTFTFAKNKGQTAPQYYQPGEEVRLYAKGTMVVSGSDMTKMVFSISKKGQERMATISVTSGTATYDATAHTLTWEGPAASEVSFTVGDKADLGTDGSTAAGQFDWTQVVISGSGVVTPKAQAPVFEPASGTIIPEGGLSVTITAAAGAKIYYTTDGTDPTTASDEYASPIVITKATTIKAMAAEEGKDNSAIVTAVYKEPAAAVADIKAFLDKADTENAVTITGPVVVSGQFTYGSGMSLYVQDETGSLLIFDKSKKLPAYAAGDRLSNISGVYSVYGGAAQMIPDVATFGAATAGEAPQPKVVTIPEVTADMSHEYVKLVNVAIQTSTENAKDHYAVSGSDQILLFNKFSYTFPADGEGYDVYGYVAQYNGAVQLYPAEITKTGTEPEKHEVATVAEFLEKAAADETTVWTITGDVKTVYQAGSNLYIQDVEAPYTGLLVYGSLGKTYEPGTILNNIKGSYKNYYSTIEMVAQTASFTDGTIGSEPVATTMALENITGDVQNLYVQLEKVTISDFDATTKNFTITDAKDDTLSGYQKFTQVTIPEDTNEYNVFGFVSYYQAKGEDAPKVQFYPINFVDAAGVAGVAIDSNAPAEYYTIDGLRVAQPSEGIYIVRHGSVVKKVIIRK